MILIEDKTGRRVRVLEKTDTGVFYRYVGENITYAMRPSIFHKLFREPKEGESFKQLTAEQLWDYGIKRLNAKLAEVDKHRQQRQDRINEEYAKRIDRMEALVDENIVITHRVVVKRTILIYYNINDTYFYKLSIRKNSSMCNSWLNDAYETLFRDIGIDKASTFIANELKLNREALYYMMMQIRRIAVKNHKHTILETRKIDMSDEEREFEARKRAKAKEWDKKLEEELEQMKKDRMRDY